MDFAGKVWTAIMLSAIAQYILGSVQPGPVYCSILFFALELFLLNRARQTGKLQSLYCAPVIFLLWANLDTQFIYGLALLLLFLITQLVRVPIQATPQNSRHFPRCA